MKINKINYPKCPYCGLIINDLTKIPSSLFFYQMGSELKCPSDKCGKQFDIDSRIEVSFITEKIDK